MQTMPFVFLLSLDQISEQAFPAPFKYTLRGDSVCNLHMGVGFKSRKTMTHTRFGMFEVSCQSVRRVMSATTRGCTRSQAACVCLYLTNCFAFCLARRVSIKRSMV